MESKVNYTIVGIFMLIVIAVAVCIVLWLTTGFEQADYKTYLVYMNESVAGLSKNAPVKYNGVDEGVVSDIELNLANPQQVILTLKIKPEVPITVTTEAVLTEQGITGIAYIGLRGGGDAPLLKIRPGEKYPVIRSAPSFLVRVDTTLQKLTDNIDKISKSVTQILSKKNLAHFGDILENVNKISATLAKNSDNIDASIKSMRVFMKNSANASKQFPKLMDDIRRSADSLHTMTQKITATTKNINSTFKHGDVAVQSISNQLLPQAYDTLQSMQTIADNLKVLTQELKKNPSIIIRGKKPKKPGPGE